MRIEGCFSTRAVQIDGIELVPAASQRAWNHSPDGFNWGYGGSGPAQLALAILLQAGLSPARAIALHQAFKWAFIAPLPQMDFVIEIDVASWIAGQRAD